MKCDNKEIPFYLHWNNRKTFEDKDYYYFHKLYRIKPKENPIVIQPAWINAISCKWSKLIIRNHIILEPDIKIGDEYDFVFIEEIRKYQKKSILNETHEFNGTHVLSCILKHTPLPCDYSHSEILIRHRIYKNNKTTPYFDETYTYDSWANKTAMLKRMKIKFFKDLKNDFRVDMIKLISRESSQNTDFLNFKAMLCLVKWANVA